MAHLERSGFAALSLRKPYSAAEAAAPVVPGAAHPVHRGRGAAPQAALYLPQPPEGFQKPRRLRAPRAAGSRHRCGRRALARQLRRRPGQAGRARGHIPACRTSGSAGRGLQPPLRLPGPQAAMTPETECTRVQKPEVEEEPILQARGGGPRRGGSRADQRNWVLEKSPERRWGNTWCKMEKLRSHLLFGILGHQLVWLLLRCALFLSTRPFRGLE
ncbi:uncharacterized protein LOC113932653 [Zalophus californianus]|uniref:Uncharacterized protein LOC113932653 n=1 Tax=Zalophus californianus TaxID=9704 RepID=A0A6J2EFN7_ZALCA|nr:uncharacterized protein LOC113932653 [Zalophus californianus]